ncbi:non-homologous end-joining DNA ligase [Bradyrhizobium sp. WSM471]|uniref:non-homologous end-joining DNA ligase n=1 Tax=Bradyrhizobium sp. WSM471 TaxID=319017 RepID=UPI00024D2D91|nr:MULTISPECIES: non-homologous end-joining DNA ligase [Bradyrhizobium]EHR03216.1 DNA polymerase LigD-like ligase domain-containing protein [Bradyrhizobium sp. WSM471]UFW38444.1 non-homologous end-joining DNA ligase [Bradyrhizobium canariense]
MASERKKVVPIGVKAPYPGFIEPLLAEQVDRVPRGDRWLHEIKYDGYRAQLHIVGEDIKVFTRRGHDWTRRFRKIVEDATVITAGSAIIDGEIVVPGEGGKTDFSQLQNSLRGRAQNIVMVAFDLLYLQSRDLRRMPLGKRKAVLKELIEGSPVQYSEDFEIDGAELYRRACQAGLEGIVSKVAGSPYLGGRWVKTTCAHRETLAIAGFALDGSKWDGIFLGRHKGDDLVYAGKVDHGFDKASETELRKRLKPLIRKSQPFAKRVAHKGIWVEPKLLAEVEYRGKSAEGKVRHPSFKGLRDDL